MRRFQFPLVLKLTIGLSLGMTAVLAAYGALSIKREVDLFDRTKRQFGEVLGFELAARVAEGWRQRGPEAATLLLETIDSRKKDVQVRWISRNVQNRSAHDASLSSKAEEALREGRHIAFTRTASDGTTQLLTYVPIPAPGFGAIEVAESYTDRGVYVRTSVRRLLLALMAFVVVNGALAFALSSWLVGRPINVLIDKAAQVGRGDFSRDIVLRRRDEIGKLAVAMTSMSSELHAARELAEKKEAARVAAEHGLRHAERLATVGKLAAGVAHEIGTPLNVISGRAKGIERKPHEHERVVNNAGIIREQTERITQIVRHLLDFARRQGGRQAAADIPRLARQTVEVLESTVKKHKGVEVAVEATSGALTASVEPMQMQQVLTNLIMNAMQAMPNGGRVAVRVDTETASPPAAVGAERGEYIKVSVADEGSGIEPENLEHVFEPFFTTKDVGEGTGLGLSVAHGIVQDHSGWMTAESSPGAGSTFSVYLPRASAQ